MKQKAPSPALLLITDAQVGNEEELLELVRSHNEDLSLFTMGIDTAINYALIDGLADAGNGLAEHIYPGESITNKVIRQFARLKQPRLDWTELSSPRSKNIATMPGLPRVLFTDEVYNFVGRSPVLGRYRYLVLQGNYDGQLYTEQIPVQKGAEGRLLALRWAQDRIRMIEKLIETCSERKGVSLRREAVQLSMKYGILSPFTSLLAIHERPDPETGEVRSTVVPVAMPHQWDVRDNLMCLSYSSSLTLQSENLDFMQRRGPRSRLSPLLGEPGHFSEVYHLEEQPEQRLLNTVCMQQNADGSYGRGEERTLATARFIVAAIKSGCDYELYSHQLRKAGKYLLDKTPANSTPPLVLALNLLVINDILRNSQEIAAVRALILCLPEEEQKLVKEPQDRSIERILQVKSGHLSMLGLLESLLQA